MTKRTFEALAASAALDVHATAFRMDFCTAAEIVTWAEEPQLIAEPGEPSPVIPEALHQAAKLCCEWFGPKARRQQ